jgi:hypothetical protein
MKKRTIVAIATGALSVAAVSLGSVSHADPADAMSTLSDLQSQGYVVFINKMGGVAPLSECTVVKVRPGQMVTRMDSGSGKPGSSDDIITTTEVMTIYVDVQC